MAVSVQVRERVNFQKDVVNSLVRGLIKQRESGELCDVTLCVDCKFFQAHKAVLAARSPYFRSMFTSNMKEERSTQIDLSESLILERTESFCTVLDFMYSGEIELTSDNTEDLLRIADFLLLEDIKDYCRQYYLRNGNLNLHNCLRLSVLAEHHNLPEVAYVAKNMVKSRFHDHIIFSEEILEIPENVMLKLLRDPETMTFVNNDNLVQCIIRWVNRDHTRQHALPTLLSSIKLATLNADSVHLLLHEPSIQRDKKLVDRLRSIPVRGAEGGDIFYTKSPKQKLQSPTLCISCDGDDNRICTAHITGKPQQPVLVATNCSSSLKFLKIMVYSTQEKRWYNVPKVDSVIHVIPTRLTVCNMVLSNNILYMYLSHCLPYPSDMLRIHIMALDVASGQIRMHVFKHYKGQSECCKTTLTDDKAVPPVMVYCRGYLCVVGNREGSGQVYLCDTLSQTYFTFQIPGTRFISLARAVVKKDRYIYIWCRHRFGHEEYCINKEVSFIVFDCKHKSFNRYELPSPPGISYGEFSQPHILCLQGESIVVHTPGKSSLILDEIRQDWVTFPRKLPHFPHQKTPVEMPYNGYQVYAQSEQDVFICQNPAAYTTTMFCAKEGDTAGSYHLPPPVDSISLLTNGMMPAEILHSLDICDRFDFTYTKLIHNKCGLMLDYDTEESGNSGNLDSDEEDYDFDDYEYDDDIYGFYDDFEY